MKILREQIKMRYLIPVFLLLSTGCSDWFMEEPIRYNSADGELLSANNESTSVLSQEDYEKTCIRTEYYFCPGVSGPLMRIEITKDVCVDPAVVISMSECKEYLECDPHYYDLGEKPCITPDDTPGSYKSYCVKGFVEDGPCVGTPTQHLPEEEDVTLEAVTLEDTSELISEEEEIYESGPNDVVADCEKEDIDVLMILDLSASMISEIQSVHSFIQSFSTNNSEGSIKWSLIVGPKNAGNKPGNHNFLYLVSNLQSINDFQDALNEVLSYNMIGQYEMLYDALYLSLRNISSFLPYQWDELLWPVWVGNVIDESVPPIEEFYVNWRENSKKLIIVFTDEPGQSFLIPTSKVGKTYNTNDTITQEKLVMMLESIENIHLYAFTDSSSDKVKGAWLPLTLAASGDSFELSDNSENTIKILEEIFDKETCY